MPLEKGPVGSPAFKRNIETEMAAGKPQKQAVAIAYSEAGERKDGGMDMDMDKLDAVLDAVSRMDARLDAMEKRRDALVEGKKTPDEPYGKDNDYADPGYQEDGKKRYPLGSEEEVRAAWNYIHKGKDADKYSPEHLKEIKARIVRAWHEKIGKDGPPSTS